VPKPLLSDLWMHTISQKLRRVGAT